MMPFRASHAIVVLLTVSGAHPAPAQVRATVPLQNAAGCYDLSYPDPSGTSRIVGRMVLDTTITNSRIDPGGFRLRSIGEPGHSGPVPGGTWRFGGNDSLFFTLVGRDGGTRFGFPQLGPDTLRGWARSFGVGADTASVQAALAVKQRACGGS